MKILAIDTTEATSSVALTDDEKLIGVFTLDASNTHSETLLPMIDALLSSTKHSLADVDMFACAVGPGSFTGLRIGAATLKGLALPDSKMCVGVSSLEALSHNMASFDGLVAAVINARRGQFYFSLYRFTNGEGELLIPDTIMMKDDIVKLLGDYGEKVCFTGSGAEELSQLVPSSCAVPPLEMRENAYSVALCAIRKFRTSSESERADFKADSLNPVYLRKTQAERELEEKNTNNFGG